MALCKSGAEVLFFNCKTYINSSAKKSDRILKYHLHKALSY